MSEVYKKNRSDLEGPSNSVISSSIPRYFDLPNLVWSAVMWGCSLQICVSFCSPAAAMFFLQLGAMILICCADLRLSALSKPQQPWNLRHFVAGVSGKVSEKSIQWNDAEVVAPCFLCMVKRCTMFPYIISRCHSQASLPPPLVLCAYALNHSAIIFHHNNI